MNQSTSTLHEVNSFFRTVVMCVLIGAVGYGGGWVYQNLYPSAALREKDRQIEETRRQLAVAESNVNQLNQDLTTANEQIDRLFTSMRYLKVMKRVADLVVLRQMENPQTGRALTEIALQEINAQGAPIEEARKFTIEGDVVYIDYWVVKFDDQLVEQGDPERGLSLCTFKRLFGEFQEPNEGYTLDEYGQRPDIYGRGAMTPFEQNIWSDFWNLANDPSRARELGIRAAHGEAVSMQVREGVHYRVEMRASGGLSIRPVDPNTPATANSERPS